MATATITKTAAKGGSFLLESLRPGEVFTPADLSDDQKLIGRTAEEFVVKEVLPLVKDLENKKPGLMPALVKKAGELGLLSGGIPEQYGGAGLDKRTPASARFPSSISAPKSRRKNIFPSWPPANGLARTVSPSLRRARTRRIP